MSYLWERNTSKAEAGWKSRAVGCEPQEHMCLVWDNVAKVGGSDCYIWSSKKRGRTEKKAPRWAWFKELEFIRIPLCGNLFSIIVANQKASQNKDPITHCDWRHSMIIILHVKINRCNHICILKRKTESGVNEYLTCRKTETETRWSIMLKPFVLGAPCQYLVGPPFCF